MSEDLESLNGEFWQADTPSRRVPGVLTLTGAPALETLGRIFDERAYVVDVTPYGGVTISHSGDPEDLVADWEPRTIHGELFDGTSVSIVGAQGGKKRSAKLFDPEYRQIFGTVRHVVLGGLIDDRQTFARCRFRLDGPNWLRYHDGEAVTSDGGCLVSATEGGAHWFEFAPAQAMTITDLDRWVLHPIETLAHLVTFNAAEAVNLQVRLTVESPWRRVHREEQSISAGSHELLDANHLTPERCATWMEFRRTSDGLDAGALDDLRGVAIQTAVLTLASIAEGLHRRLYRNERRPHTRNCAAGHHGWKGIVQLFGRP